METAKAINIEDGDTLCSLFYNDDWNSLKKSGFFKVNFFNPKENVF